MLTMQDGGITAWRTGIIMNIEPINEERAAFAACSVYRLLRPVVAQAVASGALGTRAGAVVLGVRVGLLAGVA